MRSCARAGPLLVALLLLMVFALAPTFMSGWRPALAWTAPASHTQEVAAMATRLRSQTAFALVLSDISQIPCEMGSIMY